MTKAVDLAKTGSLVNSSGQIDLTTGVTGVLPVANGGTGSSSGVSPGGSNTQVQYNNAGAFAGSSGFVYSSGNVGIGNSSPSSKLHVTGTSNDSIVSANFTAKVQGSGGDGLGFGTIASSPYTSYIQSGYTTDITVAKYSLALNPLGGNVGIGTTSPSQLLSLSSSAAAKINIKGYSAATGTFVGMDSASDAQIWNAESGFMRFATSDTERMRITYDGNLGLGTTSPQARFHISSSSAESVVGRFQSSGATASYIGFAGSGAATTYDVRCGAAGTNIFAIATSDTERFRVGASGQLGIGGANYGTSGQVLVSQGSGAAPVWGSGGKVLQVVQTVLATAFSATTSGNTFTNITGLSVNITPTSASNKILILVDVSLNSGGVDGAPFRITRGGTAVGVGSPAGSRQASTGLSASNVTNGSQGTVSGKYLDSPATTSQITYQIQALSGGSGGTFYVNRTASYSDGAGGYNTTPISTITVMEIAA